MNRHRRAPTFAIVLAVLLSRTVRTQIDATAVQLFVVGNRPYVDVDLHGPGGQVKTAARFLVDSGGGGFIVTEPVARALGLTWGNANQENGKSFAIFTAPPAAAVGGLTLPIDKTRAAALLGTDRLLPPAAPGSADGQIPGHVLAHYHVVFDYPRGTLEIAASGMLTPKGEAMPMPVQQRSGKPRTELTIDGATYGFLVDTGASFSIVSDSLLKKWAAAHAQWKRYPGAYGDAATLGGTALQTMFVPRVKWGAQDLNDVGFVSQPDVTFAQESADMAAPIVGSLAGNVLKNFRVELDYPNQKLYLSKPDTANR